MDDLKISTVDLEMPIERANGDKIDRLRLRRPMSGDLRGISIAKLGQLDYDEVRTLLPRISLDPILGTEIDMIDTADMLEISGSVADFLFTARRKAEFRTA